MKLIDYTKLESKIEEYAQTFQNNKPFPHIVIDDFCKQLQLKKILPFIPKKYSYSYNNALENKKAEDNTTKMHEFIRETLLEFNSQEMVDFLERLSGISGLITDSNFRGGGVHSNPKNHFLGLHVDFNKHPKLGVYRRLNLICYLSEPEAGGELELAEMGEDGEAVRVVHKVTPKLNRVVIFETSKVSVHGHPNPVQGDTSRDSLAFYYYHVDNGNQEVEPHSTIFKKYPGKEDNLDSLRKIRGKGRLKNG